MMVQVPILSIGAPFTTRVCFWGNVFDLFMSFICVSPLQLVNKESHDTKNMLTSAFTMKIRSRGYNLFINVVKQNTYIQYGSPKYKGFIYMDKEW